MSNGATPNFQEISRRLLEYEAAADQRAASKGAAMFRVCEQLRVPLGRLVGFGGFRSLMSRALVLAGARDSALHRLSMKKDGSLEGLDELETKLTRDEIALAEVLVLTQLLQLLVTFIGVALTLQVLQEIWPELDQLTF